MTYHQISMYEYKFCTSTTINLNMDRINRLSWKFITIFIIFCHQLIFLFYFVYSFFKNIEKKIVNFVEEKGVSI